MVSPDGFYTSHRTSPSEVRILWTKEGFVTGGARRAKPDNQNQLDFYFSFRPDHYPYYHKKQNKIYQDYNPDSKYQE